MSGVLSNRVAIVTGSGQGIGKAVAIAMAQEGAAVVVNNRRKGSSGGDAETTCDEIIHRGGRAVALFGDISDPAIAEKLVQLAVDKFGRLDILVNNAGGCKHMKIFDITDDEWDATIKTCLYGTFYCTRAACTIMKEQDYGRIVNMASITGFGVGELAHYSAAKEGIVGFTRSIARDLIGTNITCNAMRPTAATRTTITPYWYEFDVRMYGKEKADARAKMLKERILPQDITAAVIYLASEQANNVSGCVFRATGNYVAIYDDPPRVAKMLTKKEGRWEAKELIEIIPTTLTKDIEPPVPFPRTRLAIDAAGWELANGELSPTTPTLR